MNKIINKKNCFVIIVFFLILLTTNIFAYELNSFDVTVDLHSPKSATIVEKWKFDFNNSEDIDNFKDKILKTNINISDLKKINPNLKPNVYINEYNNVKISFDEVDKYVRIEYTIEDICLIKYLDYENEIIWKFNENLFRQFVSNNLYNVPKNSYLRIKYYDPLFLGEAVPEVNKNENIIYWTGISSNELRVIFLEKKPPKPSFMISDIFKDFYLKESFIYIAGVLLFIVLILLLFKNKVSKNIKNFVIRHSKIKSKKNRKDIVDYDSL
jgi:hypothetical protein